MRDVTLSEINTQLLANAVVRVKSVDLSYTNLTTKQVNTICQSIIEKESLVLEDLSITQLGKLLVLENVRHMVREKVKKVVGLL